MMYYKVLVTVPGVGQHVEELWAHSAYEAIEICKRRNGPGSYAGVMSSHS